MYIRMVQWDLEGPLVLLGLEDHLMDPLDPVDRPDQLHLLLQLVLLLDPRDQEDLVDLLDLGYLLNLLQDPLDLGDLEVLEDL
jgi:hypothetical protein